MLCAGITVTSLLDQKLGTKLGHDGDFLWLGIGKAPMDPPIRTPRVCDCKEAEAIGKLQERWKDS